MLERRGRQCVGVRADGGPSPLICSARRPSEWAGYLLHQLRRTIALTGDPALQALDAEVRAYPGVASAVTERSSPFESAPLLVLLTLDVGGGQRLSLFTTLTTFGTPRDVTLDELAVELFYPSDDASARLLTGPSDRAAPAATALNPPLDTVGGSDRGSVRTGETITRTGDLHREPAGPAHSQVPQQPQGRLPGTSGRQNRDWVDH